MKTVLILEEKDIVGQYLSPLQNDFKSWNFHLERRQLFAPAAQLLPLMKKCSFVVLQIPSEEMNLNAALSLLETEMGDKKIILAASLSQVAAKTGETLKTLCLTNNKILHLIDLDRPSDYSLPIFRHLFTDTQWEKPESVDMEVLVELKKELDQVALTVENELQKVKKLHEHIIPKRFSEIKGVNILSKYAVGEHSGGEFFDIIYKNKKIGVILSSSSSYVVSGILLNHFSNLKKERNLDLAEIKKFMGQLAQDTGSFNPKSDNPLLIQLFVALIDLKTLSLEGYNFGNALLLSSTGQNISGNQYLLHESFFEQAFFQFRVKRGEKMILASPGIRRNTKDLIDGVPLVRYLQKQFEETPLDILNELFFQLKKDKDNDFLPYDASSIVIEVNKNVLVQA